MPIYQTAHYQVKIQSVGKVKKAIKKFVDYVKKNEPGTQMYLAWQQKNKKTHFMHFFIFKNRKAQDIHSKSKEVKEFESVYRPELTKGDVSFTDFETVAGSDHS